MELKDFIRETLTQIAQGTAEASPAIAELGGIVNPSLSATRKDASQDFLGTMPAGESVFLVDFDVAMVAQENVAGQVGAKLEIASVIRVGADGKAATATERTHRVRFHVPLVLPVDTRTSEQIREAQRKRLEALTRPLPRSGFVNNY